MTQNIELASGNPAVEAFFDATQEMLSGLAVNFEVTLLNSTTVRVVAGVGAAQVSLAIAGRYRWVTATITRVHPGGVAGTYDLYATSAADNDAITKAPPANDYSFALAIVASGATPVGVALYRLMRRVVWDGAAITAITRVETEGPGGPAGGDLAGSFPAPTISTAGIARVLPPGVIEAYAGATAPAGWLLCNGQTAARTGATLALFTAIGTTYGAGDGVSTFNVPDLRGRVPVGADNMGTDAGRLSANDALGNTGGTETHTLTSPQVPPTLVEGLTRVAVRNDAANVNVLTDVPPVGALGNPRIIGGNGSHPNTQPYQIVTYIIKT